MLCPYPDCTGRVTEGQRFCNTCGRPLDAESVTAAKRGAVAPVAPPVAPVQPPSYSQPQYPPQYSPQYSPHPPQQPQQYPPPYPQMPVQQMPVQQVARKRSGSAPIVILLLLLVLGAAVWWGLLGGRLPQSANSPASFAQATNTPAPIVGQRQANPPAAQPPNSTVQTFELNLAEFSGGKTFTSDPINGKTGSVRRLMVVARPYTASNGETTLPSIVELTLGGPQEGDPASPGLDNYLMLLTAQELVDEARTSIPSELNATVELAQANTSYETTSASGWKVRVTVNQLALDPAATMSDGTTSPYPAFRDLSLTIEVSP